MIFNNYSIRKYVYKFLQNEMTLLDWNTVGGSISTRLASSAHKVTNMSYLFSDRVFYVTNMNRLEFHYISDNFTYMYESDETSSFDKYIPKDLFILCYNDKSLDTLLSFKQSKSVDDLSSISICQQPSSFKEDVHLWSTGNVLSMEGTFFNATLFDQSLDGWDTSNVVSMKNMFRNASSFSGGNIGSWDTSKVICTDSMFRDAKMFNCDITSWNMRTVVSLKHMFSNASLFQQEIRHWKIDKIDSINVVEITHDLFLGAEEIHKFYNGQEGFASTPTLSFWRSWPIVLTSDDDHESPSNIRKAINLYLSDVTQETAVRTYGKMCNWDVSKVKDMSSLFSGQRNFNEDISSWDVSNVVSFKFMFRNCKYFNSNITLWNTETCSNMKGMFEGAEIFNRDISSWDVSNVIDMSSMFSRAVSFSYDIGIWKVNTHCITTNMFARANQFNLLYNKYINKGTPYSHFFNQSINDKSVIRITALPGNNLVGFSNPGTVETDKDITICQYQDIPRNFLSKSGAVSTKKNILLPLLSSIKCNLAPGLYNNLPIISESSRGRKCKVSLSVTNYNNIEEIVVKDSGKEYTYNDKWHILLDSVKHKLVNKSINKIYLSSFDMKVKELDFTLKRSNGNKVYEIPSCSFSAWVNVPDLVNTRTLFYRYSGKIEDKVRVPLKEGINYVGFTSSGQAHIQVNRGVNVILEDIRILELNQNSVHNSFTLQKDNFISRGLNHQNVESLIKDIGRIYGGMTGLCSDLSLITKSGKGKNARVNAVVNGNFITSMEITNIGQDYSVGDQLEINHGIRYSTTIEASDEVIEGKAHISKIKDKMNLSILSPNSEGMSHSFTPGIYEEVPVHVIKRQRQSNSTVTQHKNTIPCCGRDASSTDTDSTFVVYMDFVVTEDGIQSLAVSEKSVKEKKGVEDICAGDTINIRYGVFKTFFISHKSIYQSSKGLNPSRNNLLHQLTENKNHIIYPPGEHKNVEVVTLKGAGKGAKVNMVVNKIGEVSYVDLACIGFGYGEGDLLSVPVIPEIRVTSSNPNHISSTKQKHFTREMTMSQDTRLLATTIKDDVLEFDVNGPSRGFIIEYKSRKHPEGEGEEEEGNAALTSVSFSAKKRNLFIPVDGEDIPSTALQSNKYNMRHLTSFLDGSTKFKVEGLPLRCSSLLIGGGGSGGSLDFNKLHKGSNGGSAGEIAIGTVSLQEGETYVVTVGGGGSPQLQRENAQMENGGKTKLEISSDCEREYYQRYPALSKMRSDNYRMNGSIEVLGGSGGNNEELKEMIGINKEQDIAGNKWRFDMRLREENDENDTTYRGGIGGGGTGSSGSLGEISDPLSSRSNKGVGGRGGKGMYWSETRLSYGAGGSGCPNWEKPWQQVTFSALESDKKKYNKSMKAIEEKEMELKMMRLYKLRNSSDSMEANEIERLHKTETDNMRKDIMTKAANESLYVHSESPCFPFFPIRSLGGGGGATSNYKGYSHGDKNSGSGGSGGYWLRGTLYPNTDIVIQDNVLEPGEGGSGIVSFVYE